MAVQTVASTTNSTVDLGPAAALSCRECGHRVPLGPVFACEECFGPLEIAYDFSAYDAEELRKRIEAGPANIWRYAPLLPVPADVADKPNLNPGWTKLIKADNLARELGVDAGKLFVKDDSGNPTHSFKDRVVAQALEAARAFGFTTLSCSSTGTGRTRRASRRSGTRRR
ncbi:pyridoxal-phosphate dependent enzyme, partial [Streptomyces sp. NPDC006386]|uniref:threonine synthase n=1 Tax=Streptomyces sp. NPDC006386 TaxID=3156762 RepID=UPI0033AA8C3B